MLFAFIALKQTKSYCNIKKVLKVDFLESLKASCTSNMIDFLTRKKRLLESLFCSFLERKYYSFLITPFGHHPSDFSQLHNGMWRANFTRLTKVRAVSRHHHFAYRYLIDIRFVKCYCLFDYCFQFNEDQCQIQVCR